MIKAIIFDCFGVLAQDGWTPFKREHIEPNSDMERAVATIGRQSDVGTLSPSDTTRQMASVIGVHEEKLKQALNGKVPNLELLELIRKELKPEYRIALMSNANYDVVSGLFTGEQAALFDTFVLSFNTHLAKPDTRMYELVAERLGVEMAECLFIDDQEKYCVIAEQLGMQAIFYESFDQFKRDLTTKL